MSVPPRPYARLWMTRHEYGTTIYITGEWDGDLHLPVSMSAEIVDAIEGTSHSPFSLRIVGYSPVERAYVAVRRDAGLSDDDIAALVISYELDALPPSWMLTHPELTAATSPRDPQ